MVGKALALAAGLVAAATVQGAVLFSFWCGECAQMMAVDAHTYWRNFAVFIASMGLVVNRIDRERMKVEALR